MEDPYSKREIDTIMQAIHEKLDIMSADIKEIKEDMSADIKEIKEDGKETKEQAYKTNGRVNKHDVYFRVAWWILGVLWAALVAATPVMINIVKKEIKNTVAVELEDYIFEIQ